MSVRNFPEVYHGQGINEAVFSGPAGRLTEQGADTTCCVDRREFCHKILCQRATVPRCVEERSGTHRNRICTVGKRVRDMILTKIAI
ncbi:hypothetical protein FEK94_27630, partial [Escherichia coli]|nr:hypothetical protein [Escherichia coli]